MNYELPEESIPAFNHHYKVGTSLADAVMVLKEESGAKRKKLGFWSRRKARKAIEHLQQCLRLLPEHWPSLWALGKVHQALGEHHAALVHFAQAARVNPGHIEVLREASIAAVDAGAPAEASKYSGMALEVAPNDAELWCNHAINLLVNAEDATALQAIGKALAINPHDPITQNAERLIVAVTSGRRARPTWQELAPY